MSAVAGVGATRPRRRPLARLLGACTTRGQALLLVGALCCTAAVVVGAPLLLRAGVLLVSLPLLSAWAVSRTRYRLACSREVKPPRVGAGDEARVVLRLDNLSRLPTGLLLVEDGVPPLLSARPRFVLERVEPMGGRSVTYPVRAAARGRYAVGPLRLTLTDPFGLCELSRSFTARDTVTVTPRVTPLPLVGLGGEWSGSGATRSRSMAAAGDDDATTREYRRGDPLHRVHWRSTARYGELMVRREEQPWQARATIALDARAGAHRGGGLVPETSSLEAAVSAAASVGVHLARAGYRLRLVTDSGGVALGAAADIDATLPEGEGLLLDALAVLEPSSAHGLGELLPSLSSGADSLVVAILGALAPHEADELARAHRSRTAAVAVLLDVASWTDVDPPAAGSAPPDAPASVRHSPPGHRRGTQDSAAARLAADGWRVLRMRRGDDLARLWLAAGHRSPALPLERASG